MTKTLTFLATSIAALSSVSAQLAGTQGQVDYHLPMTTQDCTSGTCTNLANSLTLDANWRWLDHGGTNCFTGNTWDSPCDTGSATTCAQSCALEGISSGQWSGTYGVTQVGQNGIQMNLVTNTNVGARLFLLDENDSTKYKIFKLKNREFSFTVDVSNLPCGLNGALYLVNMPADGGKAQYSTNKAGATFGTGYCDAQCPQDVKFIDGLANNVGWTPSQVNKNSGTGQTGTCCGEIDIWEANSQSTQLTMHACSSVTPVACNGPTDCGVGPDRYSSFCDKDGCDFGTYRLGNHNFYGAGSGFTIDTTKPFTVITQFVTNDGTDTGVLTEVKRQFVQNNKVFDNPSSNLPNLPSYNSITDTNCKAQKSYFGDMDIFTAKGGMGAISKTLDQGLVLVLSLWDDYAAQMLWLDSNYPTSASPSSPGVQRGPCPTTSGVPSSVEQNSPNAYVKYSAVAVSKIGFTLANMGLAPPATGPTAVGPTAVGPTAAGPTTAGPTAAGPTTAGPTATKPGSGGVATTAGSSAGATCNGGSIPLYGVCIASPGCCASGLTCYQLSSSFAQCLTGCPPGSGSTCTSLSVTNGGPSAASSTVGSSGGGSNVGLIVGLVCGLLALLLIIIAVVIRRRREGNPVNKQVDLADGSGNVVTGNNNPLNKASGGLAGPTINRV